MKVGFIGLGNMGLPMASNMARAGFELVVWNRTAARTQTLARLGAVVAESPARVFEEAEIVILMLADGSVMDVVLERGTDTFASFVRDHTIVHMGTTEASYSQDLCRDVQYAGGKYVEAPVSGSSGPAAGGQLVGMLAGDAATVDDVLPLLAPLCRSTIDCGAVPGAMRMKLAVNLFLVTQVAGLVESFHLASRLGLDLVTFQSVLDAGPMASAVSRVKLEKLVTGDLSPQASVENVCYNAKLISASARDSATSAPLIDSCFALFAEAVELGHDGEDMAAVLRAFEARTDNAQAQ